MSDWKWNAQVRAENLATDRGEEFFDLPVEQQHKLYEQGLEDEVEGMADAADYRRKAERENEPQQRREPGHVCPTDESDR